MMAGLLARLTGRTTEQRSIGSSLFPGMPVGTSSGQMVNPNTAENLAAVMACVGAIASTTASLPAYVYRTTPGGRSEAPDHPVSRLIRRPNELQTWPDFIEWWISQVVLHGNAVAEIVTDGAGRPVALLPIPWGNVSPVLLPGSRLALDVGGLSIALGRHGPVQAASAGRVHAPEGPFR